MFIQILQVILILAMFILIRWFAWKVTEVWGLPEWLQYKPWNCKLCLTFWSLLFSYLTVGLIFNLPITLYGGIALAILNALAMWIDQKRKTIKIDVDGIKNDRIIYSTLDNNNNIIIKTNEMDK